MKKMLLTGWIIAGVLALFFHLSWWVWIIYVIILLALIGSLVPDEDQKKQSSPTKVNVPKKKEEIVENDETADEDVEDNAVAAEQAEQKTVIPSESKHYMLCLTRISDNPNTQNKFYNWLSGIKPERYPKCKNIAEAGFPDLPLVVFDYLSYDLAQKVKTRFEKIYAGSVFEIQESENEFPDEFTVDFGSWLHHLEMTFVKVKGHKIYGDFWIAKNPLLFDMWASLVGVDKKKSTLFREPTSWGDVIMLDWPEEDRKKFAKSNYNPNHVMDLFKQKLKEKTDGEYPEGYVCGFVTRGIYQYALYGGHLGNKHKYIGTDNFETLKAGNAFNALGIRVRGLHVLALRYRDDKVLHGYTRYTGKDLEFTTKDHRGLFWPVISLPKQSMFNTNDYFKKQEEERQRAEALAAKKAAEQAAKQAAVNEAVLRRQKLMKKNNDN